MVNGYPCFNCADAALAKRGINPAEANGPANSPNAVTAVQEAARGTGQLQAGLRQEADTGELGRRSAPTGGRGQLIDLVA